jgi:hypothetical protein
LNIGVISINSEKSTVLFSINKFQDLIEILIPIFDAYPLQTTKVLDFIDFKTAILMAQDSKKENSFNILRIKSNMNLKRTNFDAYSNYSISINPYWLLGFFEGEGTFRLRESIPYLQIAQKNKSEQLLNAIMDFMKTLSSTFIQTKNSPYPKGYSFINNKTNVISCVWSDIETSMRFYFTIFF